MDAALLSGRKARRSPGAQEAAPERQRPVRGESFGLTVLPRFASKDSTVRECSGLAVRRIIRCQLPIPECLLPNRVSGSRVLHLGSDDAWTVLHFSASHPIEELESRLSRTTEPGRQPLNNKPPGAFGHCQYIECRATANVPQRLAWLRHASRDCAGL